VKSAKCKILQEGETNNFLYKPEPHDFKVVQWECKMLKPLRCSDINKVNINKQIDTVFKTLLSQLCEKNWDREIHVTAKKNTRLQVRVVKFMAILQDPWFLQDHLSSPFQVEPPIYPWALVLLEWPILIRCIFYRSVCKMGKVCTVGWTWLSNLSLVKLCSHYKVLESVYILRRCLPEW